MRSLIFQKRRAVVSLFACMFVTFMSDAMTGSDSSPVRSVQLDGRIFRIPERYFEDEGQMPSWLRPPSRLDESSRELLLKIDAEEAAATISQYQRTLGHYDDYLQLRLVVLTREEKQRYSDPDQFADIWNSTGSYQDRIIETDTESGVARVYRRIEYPNSWEVFTIAPTSMAIPRDLFSFWIGHCLKVHSPMTASGSLVTCDSYVLVDNVAVNFRVSEQNLYLIDEVREFLRSKIRLWQAN